MKLTSMVLALAGFAVLAGCDSPTPALLSLERVATAQETAIDATLLGTWEEQGDPGTLCVIRQDEHSGYQVLVLAGGAPASFQAQLFRVGDVELLDVTPADDNDFRIPGHAVARVWTGAGALRWAFLDSDWLKQQAAPLATHAADGKMLLLSPAVAVRTFVAANAANDKAYGKVATWIKVP
jgi:hypothetical protein